MRIFTPHSGSVSLSLLLEANPNIEFVFEAYSQHSKRYPRIEWPEGHIYTAKEETSDFHLVVTRSIHSSTYRNNEVVLVSFCGKHLCYGKRFILGEYTYEEARRLKSWQGVQLEEPTREMLLPLIALLEEMK